MGTRSLLRLLALVAVLAMLAAACGPGDEQAETPDETDGATDTEAPDDDATEPPPDDEAPAGGDLIVGTTDSIVSLDPAKIYDYYSSNILFNAGETLVGFQPGETEVTPLLAESVDVSDDGLTYTFTLREGVTFHDGSEMTAEDVKFSLERAININHPQGAAFLIDGATSIEAPDDRTVVMTLDEPNITFLSRLAYVTGTVLPSDGAYTAPDGPLEEGADPDEFINEELVATGPYRVEEFREGESITLVANEDYWGDPPANDRVLVRFFADSAQMKAALEAGEIDIAFRDLSPDERADLEGNADIQIIEGDGASIRYLVLNVTQPPVDDVNVRKAIAAAVERDRIIEDVFAGAATPLHSMIPTGFTEYQPYFEEMYADADPNEFVDAPVELDLWYSTDHYGDTEPSIAQVLERSLEESGAFEVNLQSTEWAQFTEQAWPGETGQYPAFLLGWYPDYFDADDYIEPFYKTGGFLGMYSSEQMDQLIADEQQVSDAASEERVAIFDEVQQLAADEAPIVPLFEIIPFAYARTGVEGVQETMDPVQIFRYYLISKTE